MNYNKFTIAELEEKAQNIMDRFEFKNVHAYMVMTDWSWTTSEGFKVPDLEEIKSQAHQLLTSVIWDEETTASASTGGFHAYKFPWGLKLTFTIEWSHS